VVLVTDAPAATIKIPIIDDQALFVLLLVVLSFHDPATGGPVAFEADAHGNHGLPSFTERQAA
jgi:hypothetical protein